MEKTAMMATASRGRLARAVRAALLVPLLAIPGACEEHGSEPTSEARQTIARETFVETYVDLRVTALGSPEGEITPERRRQVLERHGVTEDELLRFVEVRGRDAQFMNGVWQDVESRIDSLSNPDDTAST